MEKARAAVSDFMSKSGHHETTVHESVAPSVVNETVKEQRHEQVTTATDREIHQDHFHTSVQPVHDREVLAEQHHHNLAAVEHRTHDHRDHEGTKAKIAQEAAQFKDHTVRAPVTHQTSAAPTVVGEHVHHHVHETIQPVIHKETIEQHVVHTTVPIHETHHNAAQHHTASALPAVSLADFKKQGGSLTGREERSDHFAGEPRNIDRSLGTAVTGHHTGHNHGAGVGSGLGHSNTTGPHSSNLENKIDPRVDSDRDGSRNMGAATGTNNLPGQHSSGLGSTGHNDAYNTTSNTSGTSSTGHKPSLMDKLNPMKDSNGDGKKGFMK